MSLGYIFGGFNLTSYVEGNPNQDIYWRELGWCGYCSEKVGCCEIMNYSVTNDIYGSNALYERLSCPFENSVFSSSNITWCKDKCGLCYRDPEETIWKIGIGTYEGEEATNKGSGMLIYGGSLMVTLLGLLFLYMANRVTRSKKSWRKYTLLPMLEPYLKLSSLFYVGMIAFYASTLKGDPIVGSGKAVCCSQWTSVRLLVLCWWLNFETLVPFNLLLQRSYTFRAFRETFVTVALICLPTACLVGLVVMFPFMESDENRNDPEATANIALGFSIAVVTYQWMLVLYVFVRLFWNRFYINSKRHVLIYAIPFCIYYIYLASSFSTQAVGYDSNIFWIVVCIWSILRLPIIYYCLWAETQFWIRDDKEGRVRRLSRGVIDELQEFLDNNRGILVDYFSIKFGPEIGSGATAQVYKGTYRGTEVAIKVYTPDSIDLDLLRSFADEIKIMIPLTHRNVAAVTGLSVMPPHIVIVLPMYKGGDLKDLLDKQVQIQESLIREKRASMERCHMHGNRMEDFLQDSAGKEGEEEKDEERKKNSVQDIIPVHLGPSLLVDDTSENQAEMTYVAKMAKGNATETIGRVEKRKNMRTRESSTSSQDSIGYVESKSNGDKNSTIGSDSGKLLSEQENMTSESLSIFSSYAHLKGHLFDERGLLTWKARLTMAADLCSAVSYLHKRVDPPLLHRDIKPANILLDADLHLKLSDFGESCFVSNQMGQQLKERYERTKQLESSSSRKACVPRFIRALVSWVVCCGPVIVAGVIISLLITWPAKFVTVFSSIALSCFGLISFCCVYGTCGHLCTCTRGCVKRYLCCKCCEEQKYEELSLSIRGSPSWMPKEILDGHHNCAKYGCSADCYSTAIVVWQLLSLHPLYRGLSLFKIIRGVTGGTLRPRIPPEWPIEIREMLTAAFDQNPSKRPTARMMKRTLRRVMKRLDGDGDGDSVMVLPLMESLKKMQQEKDSTSAPMSPRAQLRAYKKGHSNDDVKKDEAVEAKPLASSIMVIDEMSSGEISEIEMVTTRSGEIKLSVDDDVDDNDDDADEKKVDENEETIQGGNAISVEIRDENDVKKESQEEEEEHDHDEFSSVDEESVENEEKEDHAEKEEDKATEKDVEKQDEEENDIGEEEDKAVEKQEEEEDKAVEKQEEEEEKKEGENLEKEEEEVKDEENKKEDKDKEKKEEKKKKRTRPDAYNKLLGI